MELTLVLTHACNLGCPYCYMGKKFGRRMPKELGERALEQAFAKLPPGEEIQVGYFGGEPLLAWDLLQHFHRYAENLARAKGAKLVGTVTTNATLLTEERMDWLVEHGVVVAISLDGIKASHDATRPFVNGKSSFEAARKGLKIALERAPLTEVLCVVDPDNAEHMSANARFLLDEGARVVALSMNYSGAWNEERLAVYERELERVGAEFVRRFRAGQDVYISILDAKIVGRLKGGLKECDRCSFGLGELAVAPSGNLYPCERLVGEDADPTWVIGHLERGYDLPKLAGMLSKKHRRDPLCESCAIRDRCASHCGCSRFFSSGDLADPGAPLCLTEQINARVADRVAQTLFWEANPTFMRKFYFERNLPAALAEAREAPAGELLALAGA
ncbi:MAG: radical SAM protein [Planctomycetota bacterium]|nr:radical SAM protein [Planctomycetota bacterium]